MDGTASPIAGASAIDVDAAFRPTHDERARQGVVGVMRNHAFHVLREQVGREYEERVKPRLQAQGQTVPADGHAIERAMRSNLLYQVYSAFRYNAQEMMYLSVQPAVERGLPAMVEAARTAARARPSGGTLRLDAAVATPAYTAASDIHLAPGCFYSEYTDDDVAQAAVLAHGGRVGTGAMAHRKDVGGVGRSVGWWLKRSRPGFAPRRILDIGTQSGKNLLPYAEYWPEAELHGVDISAPTLRYGHAKAEHEGVPVHFSQQNAEALDFPDGHFDLIVSSFFFHEAPVPATRRILKECRRLLAAGGVMAHMELPPQAFSTPVLDFMWDWDAKNNNEPAYAAFRAQDLAALCREAGFAPGGVFQRVIPDRGGVPDADYDRMLADEIPSPRHGRGGWFVFGAQG